MKSYYLFFFLWQKLACIIYNVHGLQWISQDFLNEKCNGQKSNCDRVLLTPFMTFPSWKHTVVGMYMTLHAVSILSIISATSHSSVHSLCAITIKNQLIKTHVLQVYMQSNKTSQENHVYIRYIWKWLGSSFHYIKCYTVRLDAHRIQWPNVVFAFKAKVQFGLAQTFSW